MQLHASLAVFSGYVVYGGLILRTVFAVPRKVLASKGGPAALASLTQTSPAVTAYFVASSSSQSVGLQLSCLKPGSRVTLTCRIHLHLDSLDTSVLHGHFLWLVPITDQAMLPRVWKCCDRELVTAYNSCN